MVDIHTHILPFVDDGSNDFEESMNIIDGLISQGVKHIFLTPHYYKQRNYLSVYEENLEIFEALKDRVKDKDVSLYLANEIKYSLDIFKYIEEGKVRPLSQNIYLIEFSVDTSAYDIFEAVHNMISKGYRPIIAHIERYEALENIEDVKQLKKLGALIQVNVSALLGHYGGSVKRKIKKLIKNDLVDFVATDSHRYHQNSFKKGFDYISKKFSHEMAEKIFNNTSIVTKN